MRLEEQLKERYPPTSAEAVLRTIMKLRDLGCGYEEIATRLLSGGMDTIAFRVQGLVEIAIACATHRKLKFERATDGGTPSYQGN